MVKCIVDDIWLTRERRRERKPGEDRALYASECWKQESSDNWPEVVLRDGEWSGVWLTIYSWREKEEERSKWLTELSILDRWKQGASHNSAAVITPVSEWSRVWLTRERRRGKKVQRLESEEILYTFRLWGRGSGEGLIHQPQFIEKLNDEVNCPWEKEKKKRKWSAWRMVRYLYPKHLKAGRAGHNSLTCNGLGNWMTKCKILDEKKDWNEVETSGTSWDDCLSGRWVDDGLGFRWSL